MSKIEDGEPPRHRAVVLVGHGAVPRDYPRERLLHLRALETSRCASGAPPSEEQAAVEQELRHWPRTPANDPYQAGLKSLAAHLRPRLEPTRLVLAYNEFCAPTVAEAIRALAGEGVADIVAVPSMFPPGGRPCRERHTARCSSAKGHAYRRPRCGSSARNAPMV